MTLSRRPKKCHVTLDLDVYVALTALAERRGGKRAGVTLSGLLNEGAREHLARAEMAAPWGVIEQAIDRVLGERLSQVEVWLRPMLANTGISATAALLASIEGICGTRLPKDKVVEYTDLLRGRAWHLFRRPLRDPSDRAEG